MSYKEWYCPQCRHSERTPIGTPNRYHTCPKLRGLATPLVARGVKARIILREREDYIGRDAGNVQLMEGRPVMSMVTERADGSNDARVYAPVIRVRIGGD